MSKAFTRDDDGVPPPEPTAGPRLPEGVPSYVTARGHARLRAKLEVLRAAGNGASATALAAQLERAQIVPERPAGDTVRFGDVVTLQQGEAVRRVRIVGIDEVDLPREPGIEPLSFLAPLARMLIGAEVGDVIGDDELEVLAIDVG